MEKEIYHRVIPERFCEAVKGFVGRLVGLNIDWNVRAAEAPLDTPLEPVVDWPGHEA